METTNTLKLEQKEQKKFGSILIDFLGAILNASRGGLLKLNNIEKESLVRDFTRAKILNDRAGQLSFSEENKLINLLNQNWFRYELYLPEEIKGKLFDRVLSKHKQEVLIKRGLYQLSSHLSDSYNPVYEGKFNELQACLEKLENGPLLIIDELKIFNLI